MIVASGEDRAVYLAESRSLALLEVLVHLQSEAALAQYVYLRVDYEARDCDELDRARLPRDWRASPAPAALARIGDEWSIAGRSLFLAVPSAIVPEERLLLLNPRYPRARRLQIGAPEPVGLDPRLTR